MEDAVRGLGFAGLGSRMKRIGERLQADTQRIFDAVDLPVQPGQLMLLMTLHRMGRATIGDLAQSIGISQPGITRTAAQLAEIGFVDITQAEEDQRRRYVELSAAGWALVERADREVTPLVRGAVADLCRDLSGPLLDQLTALEDGLAALPLDRRLARPAKDKTA